MKGIVLIRPEAFLQRFDLLLRIAEKEICPEFHSNELVRAKLSSLYPVWFECKQERSC